MCMCVHVCAWGVRVLCVQVCACVCMGVHGGVRVLCVQVCACEFEMQEPILKSSETSPIGIVKNKTFNSAPDGERLKYRPSLALSQSLSLSLSPFLNLSLSIFALSSMRHSDLLQQTRLLMSPLSSNPWQNIELPSPTQTDNLLFFTFTSIPLSSRNAAD